MGIMNAITVEHNFFTDIEEAKRDISDNKLHGGKTEFEAPPSGGTPIHWHDVSQYVYITDGVFRFTVPATSQTHDCGPGSELVIPDRVLHIEAAHKRYKGVIGINKESFPQPFVRAPEELEELETAESSASKVS